MLVLESDAAFSLYRTRSRQRFRLRDTHLYWRFQIRRTRLELFCYELSMMEAPMIGSFSLDFSGRALTVVAHCFWKRPHRPSRCFIPNPCRGMSRLCVRRTRARLKNVSDARNIYSISHASKRRVYSPCVNWPNLLPISPHKVGFTRSARMLAMLDGITELIPRSSSTLV